jgi:hypothetical protein
MLLRCVSVHVPRLHLRQRSEHLDVGFEVWAILVKIRVINHTLHNRVSKVNERFDEGHEVDIEKRWVLRAKQIGSILYEGVPSLNSRDQGLVLFSILAS